MWYVLGAALMGIVLLAIAAKFEKDSIEKGHKFDTLPGGVNVIKFTGSLPSGWENYLMKISNDKLDEHIDYQLTRNAWDEGLPFDCMITDFLNEREYRDTICN